MNYKRLLKSFLLAIGFIIAGVGLAVLLTVYPKIVCILILIGFVIWFTFITYKYLEFKGE